MTPEHAELAKHAVDGIAIATWLGHLAGILSTVVIPMLTAIWLVFRIYESKTVQGWLHKRKNKKKKEENTN